MEGLPKNEIFESRLQSLKKSWEILADKEFDIGGKKRKMDMMPFEIIEEDLRNKRPVPLVRIFGGSGLRASFNWDDGIRIWFTNSFAEDKDFESAREEIKKLWEEIK